MGGYASRAEVAALREKFAGQRVRLIKFGTPDTDPAPLEDGIVGTCMAVDDAGQLQVSWDNGRRLALIPNIDEFELEK